MACNKNKFLNASPASDMIIPATLNDLQMLLDNIAVFEGSSSLPEASADDYHIPGTYWPSLSLQEQKIYLWEKELFTAQQSVTDWVVPYRQVSYANTILETLNRIPVMNYNKEMWNTIKGSALFFRSLALFNVASGFSMLYDSATYNTAAGIPLKLQTDMFEKLVRGTVKDSYDQILSDLRQAATLLPEVVPAQYKNRPSRPAAWALLARIYVSIGVYDKAGLYADSCLKQYNTLLDYNRVNTTGSYPFSLLNTETMYQAVQFDNSEIILNIMYGSYPVDTALYSSYEDDDLRKQLFFLTDNNGKAFFRGSYHGDASLFSGLAVDETYLVRAESYARAGNTTAAMDDLNHLLAHRWKTGTFVPLTAINPQEALSMILTERRKELVFRGLRWSDVKRLNREGAGIVLSRQLNGQVFQLPPKDPRYIFPIPPDVLQGTGMPQNPR